MKRFMILVFLIIPLSLVGCRNVVTYGDNKQLFKADIPTVEKLTSVKFNKETTNLIQDFSFNSASLLLKEENEMYSPISLFMALSMLSEGASKETKAELLNALKFDDLETLRIVNKTMFNNLFLNKEKSKLLLANSFWLNKNKLDTYNNDTLTILKDYYKASSFAVDFPSEDTSRMVSDWVSENTNGLLGGNPEAFKFSKETMLVLINALYFYDTWSTQFDSKNNYLDGFNSETMTTYMKQTLSKRSVLINKDYTSTFINFTNGSKMHFILPNESKTISDVKNTQTLKEVVNYESTTKYKVDIRLPKFEFNSKFDLEELARNLGINKAFEDNAEFDKFTSIDILVSKIIQESAIKVDEKGVEAAAYTSIEAGITSVEPEVQTLTFKLNRPFMFIITSSDNIPLFVGSVNSLS
ncbi:TPA: serpin family protein [bacterium]|nr:serpin family protein [bacterium]